MQLASTAACAGCCDQQNLVLQANYGAVLDAFASVGLSANKNVRSAWASFLVNLSLLLTTEAQADSDGALIAMSAVAELLNSSPKDDSETMFRRGPQIQPVKEQHDVFIKRFFTLPRCASQAALEHKCQMLKGAVSISVVVLCRGMVAAGTLMQRNGDAKGLAKDLGVPEIASQLSSSGDAKIKSVAAEVVSLL